MLLPVPNPVPPSRPSPHTNVCAIDPESAFCEGTEDFIFNMTNGLVSPDDGSIFCSAGTEVSECGPSTWYPACSYDYMTLDELKTNTEEIFHVTDAADLEEMKHRLYVMYYSDEACTELAGLKSLVSGENYELYPALAAPSCTTAVSCLLDPEGPACAAADGNQSEVVTVNFETKNEGMNVYACDPSNAAVGQPICSAFEPATCFPSSLYNGCHLRLVSAAYVAQHPLILTGQVDPFVIRDTSSAAVHYGDVVIAVSLLIMVFTIFW